MNTIDDRRTALVLGASGHIGNAITRELLAQGWRVTATSRQAQRAPNLRGLAVDYRCGAPTTVDELTRWFTGNELIVDAATPYPIHLFDFSGERRTPMEVAADRTRTLLRSCRNVNATFACVSSFTTMVDAGPTIVDAFAQHPYFGVKRAIERVVLDASEFGQNCLLINPTLCLGPWDCKARELTLLPLLGAATPPAMLDHVVNVVDVRDVARFFVAALRDGQFGRRLLCSGHNLAMKDLAHRVRLLLGQRAEAQTVGAGAASLSVLGALAGEALFASVGRNSPLPALGLMLLQRHQPFAIGAEQRRLGVLPMAIDDTVNDSVRWYAELGYC